VKKLQAIIFYFVVRPYLNRFGGTALRTCPMCGELLDHSESHGYLHMVDGDADCYGALSVGKGGFK
jgi:hypothetical protein